MTKRRRASVASQKSPDTEGDARQLLELVDAQHRVLLDLAADQIDQAAAHSMFGELQAQVRAICARLNFVPPFPWGNLDPWYWEARGLGDPDAADERLRELRARIDAGLAVLTGESRWTLVPFEDQDASFSRDVQELDDSKVEALQAALEEVLAVNGSALIGTKWMHKVVNGDGVYEFRIDNDEGQIQARTGTSDPDVDDDTAVDVLVRVFFIFDGQRVILLLSAYDKGEDDSAKRQNREIEEAKRRATRHRLRAARRG